MKSRFSKQEAESFPKSLWFVGSRNHWDRRLQMIAHTLVIAFENQHGRLKRPQASMPKAVARWVFPVPELPRSTIFSALSRYSPCASFKTSGLLSAGRLAECNWLKGVGV